MRPEGILEVIERSLLVHISIQQTEQSTRKKERKTKRKRKRLQAMYNW